MDFRSRLLATLRQVAPLFEEPGVMVVGSEVPNLLQPGIAATLVVSQDVDIGVPTLSLLEPRAAMPDPRPHRQLVRTLLRRVERQEGSLS